MTNLHNFFSLISQMITILITNVAFFLKEVFFYELLFSKLLFFANSQQKMEELPSNYRV